MLFASPHCIIDFTSGAALATLDALQVLARHGFQCQAYCASKIDGHETVSWDQLLAAIPSRRNERDTHEGVSRPVAVVSGQVPIWVFPTRSGDINVWTADESQAMLADFERLLGSVRPDVLLTYGGHPVNTAMMRMAGQRGIPVVFGLHNFAYHDPAVFRDADYVVVPSEFSRAWYLKRLGLQCQVLPYAIDWDRVVDEGSRQLAVGSRESDEGSGIASRSSIPSPLFVTFVNPQPTKGVFVFARIVEQLQRRRPDIPILVVESRGQASWLEQTHLDLSWCQNLHAMANTSDPRDFYRRTKVLLVPSLWNESLGLVAAEAMINGIPVLASSRGALPETLGARDWKLEEGARGEGLGARLRWRHARGEMIESCPSGSFVIDIPERYTPETTLVPTAEEVEPWVETIIRLWDDEKLYGERSEKAREHAKQWHSDRLGPIYAEFFRNVRPQPGPPTVPRESGIGNRESGTASGQWSVVGGQPAMNSVQPTKPSVPNHQPLTPNPYATLTSIVIVTYDQLEYTRLCIESIARHTPEPYELIVVDNGSSDGTVEFGKQVGSGEWGVGSGGTRPVRVTVTANGKNRGFPAAANQGIRAAVGQHVVLLNNDTIVTAGWLSRLQRTLCSDPGIGMVGPCSNFVSGPQCVPVPYGFAAANPGCGTGCASASGESESRTGTGGASGTHLQNESVTRECGCKPGGNDWATCRADEYLRRWGTAIDEFASKWSGANDGRMVETGRLVGFCLLIRREVIDRVGLLDERFGIGNFEDDDYCRRAIAAGFKLAIATDAFVHHFGGRKFLGAKVDHGMVMRNN